ncbi:MAG TPA: hypothetical protein VFM88_00385 [Vicinamibacteria bacterium]|nr:hypothetical protein [Vicinamibacteria bacterium]
MIRSHLLNLVVYSALVAAVFAALMREGVGRQVRLGAVLFGAFVLSAVVVGWLMAPFPG